MAADALQHWRTSTEFAHSIIQRMLARSQLSDRDRGFAQELFYGVLRNLTLLDFWIDSLRQGKLEAALRDILRLGFYQLFFLETAGHAAVFETVALARQPQRSLINALLRAALRQEGELRERAQTQPLSVQWSHPQFLLARWQEQFGGEATIDLCRWNNRPAPLYVRVNRTKKSVSDFIQENRGSSAVPSHDHFVQLPSLPREALARGDCYMQDPSTGLAARLLHPQPGERVLDACAAPGGKTGHIAELMQMSGEILACDRDRPRLELLRQNVERLGCANVRIVRHDWRSGGIETPLFDKILLDAPCTNTGVMRRRVDVRWRLQPPDFERMHDHQLAIARAVIPLLKPGGVFVYSTCSLEAEENERVVEGLIREFSSLRLEAAESVLPFRDGFDGAFVARFVSR